MLAKVFLRRFSNQYALPEPTLSFETESWFKRYQWPGNVRELENTLLRGLFLCKGEVLDIPPPDSCMANGEENPISPGSHFSAAKAAAIVSFELRYLTHVLLQAEGNVTQAAMMSGTDRSAFRKLLRRHNLSADLFRLKT